MKVLQNTKMLTVLLMIYLERREQKKVVLGKYSIFTHFPNFRNCNILLRSKPRAEILVIIADDKILSEESESRDNH